MSIERKVKQFFMKKTILFILFCLSVFSANAQVRNINGEDVVRKIDIYLPKQTAPYITLMFNYDNSLALEEMHYLTPSNGKVVLKRNGNELVRTEYYSDGKIRGDLKYHFELTDNLITRCIIDNVRLDGGIVQFSYYYQYENNRLNVSNRREFFIKGRDDYEELSDRYKETFLWDENGNVYTSDEKPWQWKMEEKQVFPIMFEDREYYETLANNTNIDLLMLYKEIDNYVRLERATEWSGKHSKYLVEKDKGTYFDYTFENEFGGTDLSKGRGKITQMDTYNRHGRLEKIFKIYYW